MSATVRENGTKSCIPGEGSMCPVARVRRATESLRLPLVTYLVYGRTDDKSGSQLDVGLE